MYLIIGCRSVICIYPYHLSHALENEVQKLVSAATDFELSCSDAVQLRQANPPWMHHCTCKVVTELGWEMRAGKIVPDLKSPKIKACAKVILHCGNLWMVFGNEAGLSCSKTLPKQSPGQYTQYTEYRFPCKLYNHCIPSAVKKVTKEPLRYSSAV